MRRPAILVSVVVLTLAGLATTGNAAVPKCFGKTPTIKGTNGNDVLRGTNGTDVIVGLGGRDRILGRGGDDFICGGGGSDQTEGEAGNDSVSGGEGSDDVIGQAGNDLVSGGGGNDYLEGNTGDDHIDGGGARFDYLGNFNAAGPMVIDLEAGTATGDGSDTLTGIEMVTGSVFDDSLTADAHGLNLIYPLAGNDAVFGGADGIDQVLFTYAEGPITADLTAGTASGEGNDTITGIESLVGSRHDDVFSGSAESDDLYGLRGNDQLFGRGGDDYIVAGIGDDISDGGEGAYDMISFFDSRTPVVASFSSATGEGSDTHSGFEILGASRFDDSITGDDGDNLLFGMGGDDSIDGAGGYDIALFDFADANMTIDLGSGSASGEGQDALANIEGAVGSPHDDTIIGDALGNVIVGLDGNDSLQGAGGADYFEPGAGDDAINGGAGLGDMVDYFFSDSGVNADLSTGIATGQGTDSLSGVEEILGSLLDDVLVGSADGNYLFGSDGNDQISGLGGDDGLDGGEGSDTLDGGGGFDDCFGGESLFECDQTVQPEGNELAQDGQGSSDFARRHR